jgi:serine/threonine protein kinase
MGLAIPITDSKNHGPAGSPRFMAPEIRDVRNYNKRVREYNREHKANMPEKRCDFTEATEVYALAVTLAETLGIKVVEGGIWAGDELLSATSFEETGLFKTKIDDPAIRKELMKLIRAMADDDPSQRPTLASAIAKMQSLQQKYENSHLHVMSQINKLAYVDVAEFAGLINSPQGIANPKLIEMIRAMKEVHVVQLVSDQFNADDARLVRHVLQREGVLVMEQAYQFKDASKKSEELSANTQQLEQKNGLLYNAFYLKADGGKSLVATQTTTVGNTDTVKEITASITSNKKQNYSKTMESSLSQLVVADKRLADIIGRINTQASKMKQDDPRKLKLETFANNLKQPINYQSLIDQLKQAEKGVMGQSKGWSRFFEAKLKVRATSTSRLVHDIRADVEHGVGVRKRR